MHARADTIPHPRIARAYRNLVLKAGFHDVEFEIRTTILPGATALQVVTGHAIAARQAGAISDKRAEAWIGEQRRRAAADRVMVAVPMFLASTTR